MKIDGFDDFVEIGRGGTAVVYSARQVGLDRRVAIKVLQAPIEDPSARRRFERECRALGAIGEMPGILDVYATAFTDDGRGCIVMRLMAGSLTDELRRNGTLTIGRAREVGVACARALQSAHDAGVVHRDLKPGNVLVDQDGRIVLADFDVASVDHVDSTTTVDAMSPAHASPERLSDAPDVGHSSDVWSLGSTLFTLVEGRPPFGTASGEGGLSGLVDRVRHQDMPGLRSTSEAASIEPSAVEFEAVLRRALAKSPSDRWPSAADFAVALETLEATPVLIRNESDLAGADVVEEPTLSPTGAVSDEFPQWGADYGSRLRRAAGVSSSDDRPTKDGRRIGQKALTAAIVALLVAIVVVVAVAIAFG